MVFESFKRMLVMRREDDPELSCFFTNVKQNIMYHTGRGG
jgi:hypothetical protein